MSCNDIDPELNLRPRTLNPKLFPLLLTILLLLQSCASLPLPPLVGKTECAFPNDSSVVHAIRDLGAKGDGITDDTDALQRGIDECCGMNGNTKVLFIPNGTYRVTRTLVVKNGIGQPGSTAIRMNHHRLPNGVKDCNAVLQTYPLNRGAKASQWFMRNIHNLTIDVGNNPETDGIRYYANNTGLLKNIRVIGHGKVGINSGFMNLNGPNMIQDAVIEGFETGILSQRMWGQTLSRITIRNCRKYGLFVMANAIGVEDLTVQNTPTAIYCDYPKTHTWWSGVVALVNGNFSGGDPNNPAILNRGVFYARNVKTSGFKMALQAKWKGKDVSGTDITEYCSHPVKKLFDTSSGALALPIKRAPRLPWEIDPEKWVCADDYGAVAGDKRDDTLAIQKAVDAAAESRKTTVFLHGAGGSYVLKGAVLVRGSVRHIVGLGFGRIVGGHGGRFIIDDDSASVVTFENLDAFGGEPVILENRSYKETMVAESCGVAVFGNGQGDIFLNNCPGRVYLSKPSQSLWARQLNPEGTDKIALIRNEGGNLWALGVKCEGKGVRFYTGDHGKTEILGMFVYGPGIKDKTDQRPLFDIDNGSFCVMGLREIAFGGPLFPVKVREKRRNKTCILDRNKEKGWIGWSMYSGWPPKVHPSNHPVPCGGLSQIRISNSEIRDKYE